MFSWLSRDSYASWGLPDFSQLKSSTWTDFTLDLQPMGSLMQIPSTNQITGVNHTLLLSCNSVLSEWTFSVKHRHNEGCSGCNIIVGRCGRSWSAQGEVSQDVSHARLWLGEGNITINNDEHDPTTFLVFLWCLVCDPEVWHQVNMPHLWVQNWRSGLQVHWAGSILSLCNLWSMMAS